MYRNYLAAALRNLVRNKLYAGINIIGLAMGFAAALLISLFARDELSYDHWIPGHERIYRVQGYALQGNTKRLFDIPALVAGDALKQDFPEIEAVTRFAQRTVSVGHGDREFMELISWAAPNLFDVLALPVLAGNLHTALTDPDGIVLTRSLARKYFGRDTPIGETLEIGRQFPLRVTAVIEDLPSNTHLNLGVIASVRSARAPEAARDPSRPDSIGFVYIRLVPGASVDRLRQDLPAFNDRHPEIRRRTNPFWIDEIVPVADIHLRPGAIGAMKPGGNADTAYSALAIAALIVIVAGFNFVNLTTARAARRAVEVGVRKVSGAERRQLIAQFIGESVFYAALGMAAAIAVAVRLLPPFNGFLERTIALDFGKDPALLGATLAIVAIVGVAAGAYPAFVLSQFSPATVLKGVSRGQRARGKGRQAMVASQFAVLIVLALVSTVIHRQVAYATTDALRFDKDQMLRVTQACLPPLVAAVRTLPGVRDVACTGDGGFIAHDSPLEITKPDGTALRSQMAEVDFGALALFGLHTAAGRLFSPDFGSDAIPDGKTFIGPSGVVINEALSRALGYRTAQDAVGKTTRFTLPFVANTEKIETAATIVGVVQDFSVLNPLDLRDTVAPRMFFVAPGDLRRGGMMNVKLSGRQIPETLTAIDGLWKRLGPPRPIERVFLDQAIDDLYREFSRLSQTVAVFAAVAVFISCLGLFGLAASAAEQRTKEIGVRKALGAGKADILRLLLWEFSQPVLWGSLVAWPMAYFIMRRWLEGFADHIDIGLWLFPAASLAALLIAILTVIGHALLVARSQPVKALRYE